MVSNLDSPRLIQVFFEFLQLWFYECWRKLSLCLGVSGVNLYHVIYNLSFSAKMLWKIIWGEDFGTIVDKDTFSMAARQQITKREQTLLLWIKKKPSKDQWTCQRRLPHRWPSFFVSCIFAMAFLLGWSRGRTEQIRVAASKIKRI